eukprot:1900748-Amphidinium_carterae.1
MNRPKFIRKSSAWMSADVAKDNQDNFAQKVRHMKFLNETPDTRVWNLNETNCRPLPLADVGWHPQHKPAVAVGDSRAQTTAYTVTLVAPVVEGSWFAHVLFAGKKCRWIHHSIQ